MSARLLCATDDAFFDIAIFTFNPNLFDYTILSKSEGKW